MRRRLLSAAVAGAMVLAGCGGGDPGEALNETAERLGDIRSGTLDLRAIVRPQGGEPLGMELEGPFSLAGEGLPVLSMRSTRLIGGERVDARLISTGERVFARIGGETRELTGDETRPLELQGGRDLGALDLDLATWIEDAQSEEGPDGTERITGALDVGAALDDLARAAGQELPAATRERLVAAVRDSSVEVLTGREDRLLRRIRIRATLDVPADLEPVLGAGGPARLELDADLTSINRPVRVDAPDGG